MSLQFIFGSSGSGKSYRLYQMLISLSIKEPEVNYIAIVPEQFTMQTQKDIVTLHPKHGVMNIDIVSFQRLAYRIFEELGCTGLVVLDDIGKTMVLRKVAGSIKKELGPFGRNLNKPGFIGQLKSMLSELYQYGVGLKDLEALAKKTEKTRGLNRKLKDLAVVYEAFAKELGEDTITSEEVLEKLCTLIPRSEIIRNSVITLDGFTGFTPVQYKLLQLLMIHAKKVVVTLTVDPSVNPYKEGSPHELFHLSRRTVAKLAGLAAEAGISRDGDEVIRQQPPYRFRKAGQLAFLEREVLRYHRTVYKSREGEEASIEVSVAANPSEEVQALGSSICRLVRDCGYRYRDIAVVTGDLAGYGPLVEQYFPKYGIPYFMDHKKSLMSNPLVEYIRSALEVIEKDFSYESVFRCLKSGIRLIDREETDELENYVLAMGIRGNKRWQQEWYKEYKNSGFIDFERLNSARQKVLDPILRLREVLKHKENTVRDFAEGLVLFLIESRAEAQIAEYAAKFAKQGDSVLEKEYEQAYGKVLELLDEIVKLLGGQCISLKEFNDILDSGFNEIKVGLIPSCVDRLVVGDMERTRLGDIRALFFIGVNDGNVPKTGERGGIFSVYDRDMLDSLQIELAPTAKKRGFIERFYLYLALTKPSEKLYISYSATGSDGKALRPSYMIGEILKLFPDMSVVTANSSEDPLYGIATEETAVSFLIRGLREYRDGQSSPAWKELYSWYYGQDEKQKLLLKLVDAAFYSYEEKGIGQAVARALYGTELSGSVTRLEKQAACAYAQFLSYGLELTERREFEFATADMGTIFHNSIELVFRKMEEAGLDWNGMDDAGRRDLVGSCVGQVTDEYGNTVLKSSARNAYLAGRIERITERTVWALSEQLKRDNFRPAGFEVSFSADDSGALKIALTEEEIMRLSGRVDRVDVCVGEDRVYIRIVDYKTGNTSFDLISVYYGLQLQLVLYLDAVAGLAKKRYPDKKIVPGGVLYYNIKDPLVDYEDGADEENIRQKILEQLQMNGLLNQDLGAPEQKKTKQVSEQQFENLRDYVSRKIRLLGREIMDGSIPVNPYKRDNRTACDYCRFKAVCGFDLKTPGYRYRRLKEKSQEEIWQEFYEQNEDKHKNGREEVR